MKCILFFMISAVYFLKDDKKQHKEHDNKCYLQLKNKTKENVWFSKTVFHGNHM